MLYAVAIVFIVIFALEAAVIIIGNVFTIFVFQSQSGLHLKRTSLLLINLAVADLLVGVGEVVVLVLHRIPRTGIRTFSLSWSLLTIGSCVSVMFLALISLERVYAVFWPLLHRVASTRAYIYSICAIWVAGLCMSGLLLLTIYHIHVDRIYAVLTHASFAFLSLLVICTSYLTIRSRLQRPALDLDFRRQASAEKTLRSSRAFFTVIAVSLVFLLPGCVMVLIKDFCSCLSSEAAWLITVLMLGNSMVNPFVYSYRMPIFQDALKKFWRKRQRNIELRTVAGRSQN